MIYDGIIEGRFVDLRSADLDDAEFTLALRMDPEIAKFFPKFEGNLQTQKNWLRQQREKEGDYFFIVSDKENNRIGTIGIYDIKGDRAEGGRIIVKETYPLQAIEAQLLLDKFAFYDLGIKIITGFIYADNQRALRFNKMFAPVFSEPEKDATGRMIIRTEGSKESFEKVRPRLEKFLYRDENGKI